METIIKTIPVNDGRLYAACNSNRYLLAKCEAEIQIIEVSNPAGALGKGRIIVGRHASLLITYKHRDVRELDYSKVDNLEFTGNALRQDGRYESIRFGNCRLETDLDLTENGNTEFYVLCSESMIQKLRRL